MAAKIPVFDYAICMACNVCADQCPLTCIEMTKTGIGNFRKVYPVLASPETCTGCSICKNACPVDAIAMEARVAATV
jgi:Na+-translocating ferredoxin:NAD+ oxidoreductase subunit B